MLIVVVTLVLIIVQRVTKLTHVNAKLDAFLNHGGIEFDPYDYVAEKVFDVLKKGDKIQAVKLYW